MAAQSLGGTCLCREHAEDIRLEVDQRRADGKPVRVSGIARRMYLELHGDGGTYTIRDIPADLWRRARVRAAQDNTDIRALLLMSLETYLADGEAKR